MTPLAETSATIALSKNEIESLCTKAARGAGYSWGLAEEAGIAAGWLAAQGIDPTRALLSVLTKRATEAQIDTPKVTPGHWQSPTGKPLCPITLGASLLDSALCPDSPFDHSTSLDPVADPMLLIAFLARAAQLRAKPIALEGPSWRVLIDAMGTIDPPSQIVTTDQSPQPMTLRPASQTPLIRPQTGLAQISGSAMQGLNLLALCTTVPATEASRQGAGSATSDND